MVNTSEAATIEFVARLRAAFDLLLEGHRCARDAVQDEWEFAVEISDLQAAGLTKNAIRWLLHKGYVKCAVEVTDALGRPGRQFRHVSNLVFPSSACLVLTETGVVYAGRLGSHGALSSSDGGGFLPTATTLTPVPAESPSAVTPHWDPDTRMLRVGEVVVKHFKVPAGNQERILSAFQEEGWPSKIDDPLPPAPTLDAKRRLHDSINRLNRNQRSRLIHFKGNGNGRAITWEVARAQ